MGAAPAPAIDRNELVEAHLSLIEPIARRLARTLPRTFALEDLIGAGRVGLLEAARRYSPADHGGAPFSAYARPRIRGAILDSVRRGAFIEATRVSASGGLDVPVTMLSEDGVDKDALGLRVASAIRMLPALQRSVLLRYYDDGLRLRAIGSEFGVGGSRASRIHMEAIRLLRRRLQS